MKAKLIKENFVRVLEAPDRVGFREFIMDNFGELDNVDFKNNYIDSDKLARHILAMANSQGGVIIFGIGESNNEILIHGLKSIRDKAEHTKQLQKYLPESLDYKILDFHYKESEYAELKGKSFQLIIVSNQDEYVPFISINDGKSISKSRIYIRRGTQSIEANNIELQKVINRKIESNYSTSTEIELKEHISQLKILFQQIKKKTYNHPFLWKMSIANAFEKEEYAVYNEDYPKEDFDLFISRMIALKKEIIEREIKK